MILLERKGSSTVEDTMQIEKDYRGLSSLRQKHEFLLMSLREILVLRKRIPRLYFEPGLVHRASLKEEANNADT